MSVFQGAASAMEQADLARMTVAQLRAIADERGVGYPAKATKRQLLQLLGG